MRSLFVLVIACLAGASWAQDKFPARAVEVILPYAAGGGVDAMGRAFAREAAQLTGKSWTVVNRDGAAGVIGFSALARAPADGYTLVFSPASPLTNAPFLNASMPFKNEHIEPVCQVFENVFAIAVKPDSPFKTLNDLTEKARTQPGKVSYGHAGNGSVPHMGVSAVARALGIQFNAIPYRGDGAMLPQLLSGELDFGAPGLSSITGKGLRVLAVLSDKPHPGVPQAPSLTQLGYPAVTPGLNGVYVPAGTPKAVIESLQEICQKVLDAEGFKQSAQTLQQIPAFLNAAQFKARIEATYRTHAELVPHLKLEKN